MKHTGYILVACLILFLSLFLVSCSEDSDEETQDGTDGDSSLSDDDDDDNDDNDDASDGDDPSDGDEDGDQVACGEIALRPLAMSEDDTFYIGPYLMQTTTDSVVVKWETEEETDGTVFYGEGDALDQQAELTGDPVALHEVKLTGLRADTRYAYQVRSGDKTSEVHHFHTAVNEGGSFRFAVWGDNQNGPATFSTVVEGIGEQQPHMLLGVGDHVQEGDRKELWHEQLFDPARALFHEVPFFAAAGNHERNSQHMYDYYSFPNPTDDPDHETVYSFTYGNAFFLVVDTNKPIFPILDTHTELSQWIEDAAQSDAAKNATWRFALAHEPGYAEAWGDGSCHYDGYDPVRNWLLPLLQENQFHAYFSGHMHGYERGMVNGVATFITGGGGGSLDAWCLDWPTTKVAHYQHHFLTVDCDCDTLTIKALYPNGEQFDWLVLSKDTYGVPVEDGPVDDLPDPVVNTDSPTLQE